MSSMTVGIDSFQKDCVALRFDTEGDLKQVAYKLDQLIERNRNSYAEVEGAGVITVDLENHIIKLHISTWVRIFAQFRPWCKQRYASSPATFPRFVFSPEHKDALLSMVTPTIFAVDENLKDIEAAKAKLKALGFNDKLNLFPHQIKRIADFLFNNRKADCSMPGAGKSAVMIAQWLLSTEGKVPLLIVCPKNALISWKEQLAIWCPEVTYLEINQTVNKRKQKLHLLETMKKKNPQVIIVNYEKLGRGVGAVLLQHYISINQKIAMVLDEAHRIKRAMSQRASAVMSVVPITHSTMRWVMTGTPMPNAEDDLLSLLTFINPMSSGFNDPRVDFSHFMTWVKPDELDLPTLHQHLVEVELSPLHSQVYRILVRGEFQELSKMNLNDIVAVEKCLQRIMMYISNPLNPNLREDNPELFDSIADAGHGAKIDKALEILAQKAKEGKKVVVWTNWRHNVDYLCNLLQSHGYNPARIDGTVVDGDRAAQLSKFKTEESCKVLIANPMAASEAISLHQVCRTAIFLDLTYNFAHKYQAERRIHRLGLPSDAHVETYYLLAKSTLDGDADSAILQMNIIGRLLFKERDHLSLYDTAENILRPMSASDTDDNASEEELKVLSPDSTTKERSDDIIDAINHIKQVSASESNKNV
jgi:precorrin-6B methylase 2